LAKGIQLKNCLKIYPALQQGKTGYPHFAAGDCSFGSYVEPMKFKIISLSLQAMIIYQEVINY